MKKKNFDGLAVIALFVSILAFGFGVFQFISIRKLQSDLNSLNYLPQIKVTNVGLYSFNEEFKNFVIEKDSLNSIVGLKADNNINTDIKFELENNGNANCHFRFILFTDTVSGDEILRKRMYSPPDLIDEMNPDNGFYRFWQIPPKGKDSFTFHESINIVEDEVFTIHLLLVYENDLGNVYDTYYWAKFQKKELDMQVQVNPSTGEVANVRIVNDSEYLKIIDENTAYKIYSKKESKKFQKYARTFYKK